MRRKLIFGMASLAFLGILISFISKLINVFHWFKMNFNMISYSPYVPVLGLIGNAIWFAMCYKTKAHKFFWVMGFGALAYNLFLLFGVINTYLM